MANPDPFQLQRFVDAQSGIFEQALSEIRAGRKQSHWMWFVFPQLAGLGRSSTAQFYGIRDADEALAYIEHPVLGPRLRQAADAVRTWAGKLSADDIFGSIDAMKLRSSLTLFAQVAEDELFANALAAFFPGPDEQTLALLRQSR